MTSITPQIRPDHSAAQVGDPLAVRVTKQKGVSERDFSKWFAKNWLGFGSRVEPGLGADTGNPDWFIQPDCLSGMIGVELKTGRVKGGTLYTDEVRPSQISWHSRLAQQGGISMFLVHTPDGIWAFDGMYANKWENGYHITGEGPDGAWEINPTLDGFSASIEWFIEEVLTS